MKFLNIIILIFIFACSSNLKINYRSPAALKLTCTEVVDSLISKKQRYKDLWQQEKQVNIEFENKKLPITFSFDSEISYADGLLVISEKQIWIDRFESIISELSIHNHSGFLLKVKNKLLDILGSKEQRIDLLNIPLDSILLMANKSHKQFIHFGGVLRKGISKDKSHYSITDLSPNLFDQYMNMIVRNLVESDKQEFISNSFSISKKDLDQFITNYKKLIYDILVKEKKLDLQIINDGAYIELPHKSYETIPKKLRDLVKNKLHTIFKWRSTHLHIGIPSKIGKIKTFDIAMAVESRIILEHAAATNNPTKLYATSYSTLYGSAFNAKKRAGVIRMNIERFQKPFPTNDLEVRNYTNLNNGMDHIALATRLAQEYENLKHLNNFSAEEIKDPYTSNLNGALKYIGLILQKNTNEELEEIAYKLLFFAKRIEDEKQISNSIRSEIYQYLRDKKILEIINPSIFIK